LKVRLDENLSYRVAGAIRAILSGRTGLTVDWVRDHHPPATTDPAWIFQFAKDGGNAILSGDSNILQNWPDLVAYMESGVISFFPPSRFEELKGYGQASLILRWWPCIIEKIKVSAPGDAWRLPWSWTPDVTAFTKLEDPRYNTAEKKRRAGVRATGTVHQFRPGGGS
jgi:hypothetical protein